MQNHIDQIVAELEREWPKWQIWVVRRYIGGPVWCARRWDGVGKTINEYSPEQLSDALEAAAGEPGAPVHRVPPDGPGVRRIPPDHS
jgi:hypothetical protein